MFSQEILDVLYRIQGAADPNHPAKTLKERMREIWDLACEVMDKTGYQPRDPLTSQ